MKRLLSLTLALALALTVFAACGKDDSSSAASSGGGSSAPLATATPQPTPAPFDGQPLTGEEKGAGYVGGRPVAVMINNRSDSRPTRGLSQADVLYEIMVEGGITRFMALFPNANFSEIGPVRSGRDQFFRLIRPYQALYLFVGRSEITQQYIDDTGYGELAVNGMKVSFAYRDPVREAQGWTTDATAYTSGEKIQSYIQSNNIDMSRELSSPIFDFVDYRESPRALGGESATSVNIVHSSSYRTAFDYDAASGKYLTSLYAPKSGYTPMVDEATGGRMAFENVIVLFTDITQYPYPGGNPHGNPDYKKVDYDFGGLGYYISNGRIEKIRWTKGPTDYPLMLQDEAGNSLKVNCGKSYVAVVSLNEYDNFSYEGDGGDATANSVAVDPNADSAAQQAEQAADAADAS